MPGTTNDPAVIGVSGQGEVTFPETVCESFGIKTPGEVFVYEEGDRLVLEPVPTVRSFTVFTPVIILLVRSSIECAISPPTNNAGRAGSAIRV